MNARVVRCPMALAVLLALAANAAPAQVLPFDSVVQNLRHPDPKVRLEALRLLRDAGYPEAAAPVAAVMTDPLPQVQEEAILTGLSFFLVEKITTRRRVGGIVELRSAPIVENLFNAGPMATRASPVPAEVIRGALGAMSSPAPRVREQATYALGVLAGAPRAPADPALARAAFDQLMVRLMDPDPAVRVAAALVSGRVTGLCRSRCAASDITTLGDGLVTALNDKALAVKMAIMVALGDLRYERAVRALTDQFEYYQKGDGARGALFALGRIAHPASLGLFRAHLSDKDEVLRRSAVEGIARVGDRAALPDMQAALAAERNVGVILALTYAVQRLGGESMVDRIVAALSQERLRDQAQGYLVELGAPIAPAVAAHLAAGTGEGRVRVAETLGLIGTEAQIPALQAAAAGRDSKVQVAAAWAIEAIRSRM